MVPASVHRIIGLREQGYTIKGYPHVACALTAMAVDALIILFLQSEAPFLRAPANAIVGIPSLQVDVHGHRRFNPIRAGVAGSRTAVAPVERLKILMQVQGNDKLYTGVFQGLMRMGRTEGLQGMFKGNGINCLRIVPNSAVKFFAYEQFSMALSRWQQRRTGSPELTPFLRLVAGSSAGVIAMSSTYPLEMVRGRISVQEGGPQIYGGIADAVRTIWRKEGFTALYRGWTPSVIGSVPYAGFNFAVYETLKVYAVAYYGVSSDRDLGPVTRLVCGSAAGVMGQTVSYPFDVIRRRLQVSGFQGAAKLHSEAGKAVVYNGMVDCFRRTVAEEGWLALYKGLWPNYVKVVPSIAIAFVVYEWVKDLLHVEQKI